MRLLVVSHSCSTPINQQVYAEIQRQTGWEFTLVVPDNWKDEFGNRLSAEAWPGFDIDLRSIPIWGNGRIVLHAYRAGWKKLLREIHPALIYMNHEPYALATAQVCHANSRSIKVPFGFYSCQNLLKRYPPPFSWLERMVYRRSTFALPITTSVADVLERKGFHGKATVCALPLDPSIYHPSLRAAPPASLCVTPGVPLIGFVGRAVESKGLRTLAQALSIIKDVKWRLVLIGTGDFLQSFQAMMAGSGLSDRVQYTGYVPHTETPRWLAAMDVLVVPSETQPNWKEQFGRVITEALACGTAVIGSDSGEIPALISQSGGGIIFQERDPAGLSDALREMLGNPSLWHQLSDAGRRWAVREVSIQAVAGRMIDTFREVSGPEREASMRHASAYP